MFYKFFTLLLVITSISCQKNNNKFVAHDETKPSEPTPFEFTAACQGKSETERVFSYDIEAGSNGSAITVQGSFCALEPKEVEGLKTILFSIDYSGSMAEVDPLTSGSCKRLEAASALLDTLDQRFSQKDLVRVSAIKFGDSASKLIEDVSLSEFINNHLNPEIFCNYNRHNTNFEASFTMLESMIKDKDEAVKKDTHIFMLTDGLPTISDSDGVCYRHKVQLSEDCLISSATAAKNLRQVTDHLNVLFLSDPESEEQSEKNKNYLINEIAGQEDRVKFAKSASEAVAQIKDFEIPETNLDSLTAKARSEGFEDAPIDPSIKLTKKDDGTWHFSTTFLIPAEAGTYRLYIDPYTDNSPLEEIFLTLEFHISMP